MTDMDPGTGATLDPSAAASSTSVEPRRSGLGSSIANRLGGNLREPEQLLAILLVIAFALRAAWITVPDRTLIFDEAYYVNAARVILGWDVAPGDHYAEDPKGLDPNSEHPPLGKVLMAGSMAVFGDNGLGWRLPSILAGMVALFALYLVVRAAGGSERLGLLALGLFAFDNLAFVHARIGTLDMMALAPILLGAWAGLRRRFVWAGALMGLGLLFKLTALYGLLALVVMVGIEILGRWRAAHRIDLSSLRPLVAIGAGFVLVVGVGLTILDLRFTSYTNPLDHLGHMVQYGAALTRQGGLPGDCISNDSTPWMWLVNDCEMRYLRIASNVTANDEIIASTASIDFRGAMNPVLLGAIVFAVPFAAWRAWKDRDRLAAWSVVWMAASYLPYFPLALLGHRVTYIYYFLPVVPALAVAIAVFLARARLPRAIAWAYVAAYLVGFAAYFPFRQIP